MIHVIIHKKNEETEEKNDLISFQAKRFRMGTPFLKVLVSEFNSRPLKKRKNKRMKREKKNNSDILNMKYVH